LLSEVGQFDTELAEFWTRVQSQPAPQRADSFQVSAPRRGTRRRRKRRTKPAQSP